MSILLDIIPPKFSRMLAIVLIATAAFHVLAGFALHRDAMSAVLLGAMGVATFWVTWQRLGYGMCIALFEIVIGVHGHMVSSTLFGFPLSLRMVIFLAVMGAWGVSLLTRRVELRFVTLRDVPIALLALGCIWAVGRGVFLGNSLGALFDDANSFIILAYAFPFASLALTETHRTWLTRTLFTGTLCVACFTFILTYLFPHLTPEYIWKVYVLVRDTRMFEVTLLSSPQWFTHFLVGGDWYFRIFSQAQVFAVFSLLILLAFVLFCKMSLRKIWVWLFAFMIILIAGASRSFFVGLIAGGITLFSVFLFARLQGYTQTFWRDVCNLGIGMGTACTLALVLIWSAISCPFPLRPSLVTSQFYRGDHDNIRELAVSSRWNMLAPLWEGVMQSPMLGSGFGRELTYQSDDPRILEMTQGTGVLTTYRFEWGFLDVWLKMGIFGLGAFAVWGGAFVLHLLQLFQKKADLAKCGLEIGLCAGIASLFALHIFTPYLNHPIGLFFLLLAGFLVLTPPMQDALGDSHEDNRAR